MCFAYPSCAWYPVIYASLKVAKTPHFHTWFSSYVVIIIFDFLSQLRWDLRGPPGGHLENYSTGVLSRFYGTSSHLDKVSVDCHLLGDTPCYHDDVIKWKQLPRYWPFVRGIHRSPVNSPHKGQWRGALMFSLLCAWITGWVNIGEAGDLRHHRVHYDVSVMWESCSDLTKW